MTGYGNSFNTPAALMVSGLLLGLWAGQGQAQVVADDVVCAGCVQATDIANGTIGPNKLIPGSINATTIANQSIGPNKLIPGSINTATIATNAIRSNKILDGAVQSVDIQDGGVTSADIADGTITGTDIANGAVTGGKLSPGVLDAIQPGVLQVTSAAFVPTGNNFSTFFNDANGYIIPSNSTNSFCARAPINLPDGVNVTDVITIFLNQPAGDGLSVRIKSISLLSNSNVFTPLEHFGRQFTGAATNLQRVFTAVNPTFRITGRRAYWVEVCITGGGVDARATRFYAIDLEYIPNV